MLKFVREVRNVRYSKRHRAHRLADWPWWISRWAGYRATPSKPLPFYLVWLWTFVAAWCGIATLLAVFGRSHYFRVTEHVPQIIASYGATAALIYGTIESPLAQPRAVFGGHIVGGFVGVSITKLFQLVPTEARYDELQWCAGSLATALTVVLMQITQTTHAPAGATALLAAVNKDVRHLGWYYLPVLLLSTTLALGVALVVNNVQRRYPLFWFEPNVPKPASNPSGFTPALPLVPERREPERERVDTLEEQKEQREPTVLSV